jgi:hypothetical protein
LTFVVKLVLFSRRDGRASCRGLGTGDGTALFRASVICRRPDAAFPACLSHAHGRAAVGIYLSSINPGAHNQNWWFTGLVVQCEVGLDSGELAAQTDNKFMSAFVRTRKPA